MMAQNIELYRTQNNVVRECELRIHLGNYLLFLTGLLNRVVAHWELKGGYPLATCEGIGAGSFQAVAPCTENPEFFSELSREFPNVRLGLTDFAKAGFV
jgi:hypothetical protein